MRFTHNSHNSDSTRSPHRLHLKIRYEFILVVLWQRTDDLHNLRWLGDPVLPADLIDEVNELDGFFGLILVDELCDDLRDCFEGHGGVVFGWLLRCCFFHRSHYYYKLKWGSLLYAFGLSGWAK